MSSYREIMDRVHTDDAMRQRVLAALSGQPNRPSRRIHIYRPLSWLPAAAVVAAIAMGVGLVQPATIPLPNAASESGSVQTDSATSTASESDGGTDLSQGTSGIQEYDSADALSQAAGFELEHIGTLPFKSEETTYTYYQQQGIAETVDYGPKDDDQICLRKAKGSDDISGDYNDYGDSETIAVNGADITLKGDGGKYSLAMWQRDGFTYSLASAKPLPQSTWERMLGSID